MVCGYDDFFLVCSEQVAPLWIDKNEKLTNLLQKIFF